jgi:protein-S-isoprenylcysteine O-methyltransferase Ste14
LFSVVRHVPYAGYTLWRTGYALASGGPLWAAAVSAFFLYDFCSRSVPILDSYMSKKYGERWEKVKRDVPYALIPGIW